MFDYYIDTESKKFEPWIKRVEVFELDSDIPLQVSPIIHRYLLLGELIDSAIVLYGRLIFYIF